MHERARVIWSALLLTSGIVAVGAQQRDPEQYAKFLESRERVEHMQVERVVSALKLQSGQTVADLGSGSGLFTRALARAVGEKGTAFAVDIDPALLAIVQRSAERSKLTNIAAVQAAPDDPKLPSPVDLIFICDTFHHLPDKPTYAKTLARYTKSGGRVAIIDFTNDWPAGHDQMRYTLSELEGWMTSAGFTRLESFDFPEDSFFVIYGKP